MIDASAPVVDVRISAISPDYCATGELDALIFAVGYESRSRYVAERMRGRYTSGLGLRFGAQEVESFADNLSWCLSEPNIVVEVASSGEDAFDLAFSLLEQLPERGGPIRVGLDVSSLSRLLIASAIWAVRVFSADRGPVELVILYAPAEFRPADSSHGPVVTFGAVIPEFAGFGEAGVGLAALIGLGYEPELAFATQQGLDPASTWLAIPTGVSPDYDSEVSRANATLLSLNEDQQFVEYDVLQPVDCFVRLESIVAGLTRDYNVVLVPFGPKILAACCMLVALYHGPSIGVWRVSAEAFGRARDQRALGPVAGMSCLIEAGR